jgi:hypothetical protein
MVDRQPTAGDALDALTDHQLVELLEATPPLQAGIGGTAQLVDLAGVTIFVKRLPLTELESRPDHLGSTANLFDLPMGCHYGVGAPGFGAWRELAALRLTSGWVEAGRTTAFPQLHRWRRLPIRAWTAALPDDLADVDTQVDYWHGAAGVRRRLEAMAGSSESLAVFLEYRPGGLDRWLTDQTAGEGRDRAIAAVERWLATDIGFMNRSGLIHFDAHFGNLLTDGRRLAIVDLGLASSPSFELSFEESAFVVANRTHDAAHTMTRLVDWLVTHFVDVPDWPARDEFIRAWADGDRQADVPDGVAEVVTRHAQVAVVINEFYRQLHLEDRRTPYPAAQVDRALSSPA